MLARRVFQIAVLLSLLSLSLASGAGNDWEEKRNEDGRMVQQMKIEAPTMTEEDQYGYNMPDKYRCDSCKAVVFHLTAALQKRQPKNRRLHEWEYNEVFEETCQDAFEGYGIKLVNGENALSGPGLKQPDNLAPGGAMIQMGGDSWKKRLSEICRKLIYDKVGEDELYDTFQSKGEIPESMCWKEMRQCSVGPKAQKSKKKAPEKKLERKTPEKGVKSQKPTKAEEKDATQEQMKIQVNADATITHIAQADSNQSSTGHQMNLETFMKSMAVQDPLGTDDISRSRSRQEWERLIVAMAGKIYSRST